jgi:hypothetical protein
MVTRAAGEVEPGIDVGFVWLCADPSLLHGDQCLGRTSCGKLGETPWTVVAAIESFSRNFTKRPCYPRVLRSCSLLLGALQLAVLLVTFEHRARAYVDPGSGFVFLQVAGSMFAGTIYYMRHRLKRIIGSMRRPARIAPPAGAEKDAAENRP